MAKDSRLKSHLPHQKILSLVLPQGYILGPILLNNLIPGLFLVIDDTETSFGNSVYHSCVAKVS